MGSTPERRAPIEVRRNRFGLVHHDRLGDGSRVDALNADRPIGSLSIPSYGAVVACTLTALILGLYRLGDKSLWGDEMNVIWFMTGERDVALSSGNGLIYLPVLQLMWWLGGTDSLFRLPAVAFGVACVPLTYGVARAMSFDRRSASLAALLAAVAPMLVAHMQQVHVYTLFCATSLLALLFYLWGRTGRHLLWWPAAAVVIAVGLHVHLFTVFVALNLVIIHLVLELRRGQSVLPLRIPTRRTATIVSVTILVCGAIVLPLLTNWIIPLGWDVVAKVFGATPDADYFKNPPQFHIDGALFARLVHQLVIWKTPYTWLVVAYGALVVLGLVAMFGRTRKAAVIAAVWLLVPPIPAAVFSFYSNIDFGSRRLIFMYPMLAICAARGVTAIAFWVSHRFPPRARFVAEEAMTWLSAAVMTVVIVQTGLRYYYSVSEYPDVKRSAILLEDRARTSDIIVAWRPERYRYYYRGSVGILDVASVEIERLQSLAAEGRRIWYLRNGNIDRWELYEPVASWVEGCSGWTCSMGGGLRLTFVPATGQDQQESLKDIAEVLEGAVAIKNDRYYLHLELAEVYRQLDQIDDSREQRRIGRELRGR